MDEVVRRLIPDDPELARVAGYAGGAGGHFVLDRGGKVFKQTAPVIKLSESATEDDHLALLGVLNSEFGRELDSLAQHLAPDPVFGQSYAEAYDSYLTSQRESRNLTEDALRAWLPPQSTRGRRTLLPSRTITVILF